MSAGTSSGCERRLDAGAYVLGALEPAEAQAFAAHLSSCRRCAEDVASLQPASDLLAHTATEGEMPGELRQRIMRQVRSEAELLSAAGAGADRVARRRRWLPDKLRSPRLAGAAGSLALACGIALGIVLAGGGGGPAGQTIHALMANVPAGASAELVRSAGRAELVVSGLPQPPQGRIYQVWIQGASGPPRPTDALFSVSRAGDGRTDVPGGLRGVRRVMVTAEPLGGSQHPTRAPIIVATI